jgi:flagellar protein FliS
MTIQAYQTQQDWEILGASPMELVQALYTGALQATRAARAALASGSIRERSQQITKACAILQELTLTLDRERGGEIAQNLAELYVYMHRRLGHANIQQIDAPLAEVETLLATLADAWNQIVTSECAPSTGESLRLSA